MSAYTKDYKLEVESFALEENALTAINEPVYDNNNQKCALVIITGMGNEKLRFNADNSFVKVEEKNVDNKRTYLMWVSEGVIKLNISSDSRTFEPVEFALEKLTESLFATVAITSHPGEIYLSWYDHV